MYGRWGYILWDRLWPSMLGGYPCTGRDICTADGDTFPGIRYARACMVDIHVQVEICTADGIHSLGFVMPEHAWWISMYCTGRDICTADGDTFSGIGYA